MARQAQAFIIVLFLSLVVIAPAGAQGRVYIDINQPFAKKIPVAAPDFQPIAAGGAPAPEVAQGLPERLNHNLDMTGMFIPLDKRSFLEADPRAGLGQGTDLNYKEWLAVGAEFVVKGGYALSADQLTLELRLWDAPGRKMLLGKRYVGGVNDGRRMINRFTNEILELLTGDPGVFGTKIVFVGGSRSNKEVYVTEFGGEGVQRISSGSGPSMMPAVAPSGAVAYVSREGSAYQLKMGNQVIASGPLYVSPAFTPGGQLLAAISGANSTNIYRFPQGGGQPAPVTEHWGINISPSVSPDGSQMAFVSDRAGSPQIYISDLGGRGLRRLTTNGKQNTDPCWSPRGDRIAFVRDSKDVFTISPDGGSEAQLTAGAGRNNRPTWSPDGRLIVFSSTRNGRHELFTMTANGERQRPLLPDLNMEQRTPFWSPARPDDNLEANP